jgi:hypothetical protein
MPAIVKITYTQRMFDSHRKSLYLPIPSKFPKKLNSTEIKTHNVVIMQADLAVSLFFCPLGDPKKSRA